MHGFRARVILWKLQSTERKKQIVNVFDYIFGSDFDVAPTFSNCLAIGNN